MKIVLHARVWTLWKFRLVSLYNVSVHLPCVKQSLHIRLLCQPTQKKTAAVDWFEESFRLAYLVRLELSGTGKKGTYIPLFSSKQFKQGISALNMSPRGIAFFSGYFQVQQPESNEFRVRDFSVFSRNYTVFGTGNIGCYYPPKLWNAFSDLSARPRFTAGALPRK